MELYCSPAYRWDGKQLWPNAFSLAICWQMSGMLSWAKSHLLVTISTRVKVVLLENVEASIIYFDTLMSVAV